MTRSHLHHFHGSVAWSIDRQGIDAAAAAALRELGFETRTAGTRAGRGRRAGITDLLVDESPTRARRRRPVALIADAFATVTGRSTRAHQHRAGAECVACAA
jgi:hypothetical protein